MTNREGGSHSWVLTHGIASTWVPGFKVCRHGEESRVKNTPEKLLGRPRRRLTSSSTEQMASSLSIRSNGLLMYRGYVTQKKYTHVCTHFFNFQIRHLSGELVSPWEISGDWNRRREKQTSTHSSLAQGRPNHQMHCELPALITFTVEARDTRGELYCSHTNRYSD